MEGLDLAISNSRAILLPIHEASSLDGPILEAYRNYALLLSQIYEETENLADINEPIKVGQVLIGHVPDDSPD
jgi:hypothetical protein